MTRRLIVLCIALAGINSSDLYAQDNEVTVVGDTIILKKPHSARKATILSALAPGAGQIYNKKYWKAPIAWGGIGACVYFISDNRKYVKRYRSELQKIEADASYVTSIVASNGIPADKSSIETILERRKTWLDMSYFALVGVYGLNILDANVDGHLFDYDISPDISMRIAPTTVFSKSPKAGLSLTLNF